MKKISKRRLFIVGGATAITLLIGGPAAAFAATVTHTGKTHFSGVIGTVSAINGTTLTVTNHKGVAYIVNATSATVQKGLGKNAATIALSAVAVNDKVAVQGTVTGTTVAATKIDDGIGAFGKAKLSEATAHAAFGTVTAVNGSTITLSHKTKDGTTNVTVTTTGDTVYKTKGATTTESAVTVGSRVVAMGTKDSTGSITDAKTVRIFTKA